MMSDFRLTQFRCNALSESRRCQRLLNTRNVGAMVLLIWIYIFFYSTEPEFHVVIKWDFRQVQFACHAMSEYPRYQRLLFTKNAVAMVLFNSKSTESKLYAVIKPDFPSRTIFISCVICVSEKYKIALHKERRNNGSTHRDFNIIYRSEPEFYVAMKPGYCLEQFCLLALSAFWKCQRLLITRNVQE